MAEEKHLEKNHQLAQCRQEFIDFSYKVSHDLQAPLRAVMGFSNLVLTSAKDRLTEQEKEDMGVIMQSANQAKFLLDGLLFYSRLSTVRHPAANVQSQILVKEGKESLQDEITAAEAVISTDELPEIYADAEQVRTLFKQLISNAVKFHQPGVAPVIHISAAPAEENMWLFRVSDNGIGIDPKFHESVFEVFRKLHAEGEYPGIGMGLTYAKRIIENHKGAIGIESAKGEGTTIWFTLPASQKEGN